MHLLPKHQLPLLLAGFAALVAGLAFSNPARAGEITYTFSGVGNGTVDAGTTAWSGDFTFVFTTDTAFITSGGGEYRQGNLGGTFTEGSYSAALLAHNIVVDNPSSARLGFFNIVASNGGAIQNSAFTTYDLSTSFGPITGTGGNLLPTLNAPPGFGTAGGDTVTLLGITSLTFTATTAVPEPSSLALFATGLAVCGLLLRHRHKAA